MSNAAYRPLSSYKTSPLMTSSQEEILSFICFYLFSADKPVQLTIFVHRQRCLLGLHCKDDPGYFVLVLP